MKSNAVKKVTPTNKNQHIQFLRGLAILAVVMIHSYIPDLPRVLIRPFINFAVALFIFLSGYLTKTQITDIGSFYAKRILRVLVPYTIWSVVYGATQGFEGFLLDFATGRCCGGIYYYIFVYVQFVILTPLICRLLQSKLRWIGWLITPIGTLIFRYLFLLADIPVLSNNYNYLFIAWFIYYYLGLALGNGNMKLSKKTGSYALFYAAAIVISMAEGLIWYKLDNFDMATTQLRLTSILTSFTFLLLCHRFLTKQPGFVTGLLGKTVILLGDCSFGIYLSHILVQQVLQKVLPRIMFFPMNFLLMLAISGTCVFLGKKILRKHSWFLGL